MCCMCTTDTQQIINGCKNMSLECQRFVKEIFSQHTERDDDDDEGMIVL